MTQNINFMYHFEKKMAHTFTVHCDYLYVCVLTIN